MKRKCSKCGAVLSQYNPGKICQLCQKKQLKQKITSFEQKITSGEDLIDAVGYADILGLKNEDSLKRLARKGKLAERIPGIRKYLWNKEAIDTWIKRVRSCGLHGIRLHDSRHTHASLLLKQGVHPKIVQERLGHGSIQITLDTYSHVAPGLQQAAADKFDDIFIRTKAIL